MMRRATQVFPLILFAATLHGQQYLISTIAGGAPPRLPNGALDVVVGEPGSVTADAAGNVYFTGLSYLFKLDSAGILHRIAGNGRCDPLGDGGPATAASMSISAIVTDAAGNLFVADNLNHRIRKITADGLVTSIAGGSDDLGTMYGLALAPNGNVFVSDADNKVIRMLTPEGVVVTVAGGGTLTSDEPIPALDAKLAGPSKMAADGEGNIYFADSYPRRIRKLSPDGMLTIIAGNGTDLDVEGRPAATAAIFDVGGIVAVEAGNIIFTEYNSYYWACSLGHCARNVNRIRKISSDGTLTTIAGAVPLPIGFSGDGGPALTAGLFLPMGLAFGPEGNLFVADSKNARLREITPDGIIRTIAGNGQHYHLLAGDGEPAANAALYKPAGLAFDNTGNLYIADYGNNRIRKTSRDGVISTLAGTGGLSNDGYSDPGFSGDGGLATAAKLNNPVAVAVDHDGNVFIADSRNNRIRRVSPDGVISTVAGNGMGAFPRGDVAIDEPLPGPVGLAVDSSGNLFISTSYKAVYKLSRDGKIRLVTDQVYSPFGLAVDGSDNLFIADSGNSRVLKVTPDGSITTVAGNGSWQFSGDGAPAIDAGVPWPGGVAVDRSGNLFITGASRIRKVSLDGTITTVAGTGTSRACLAADGELAAGAAVNPVGLVADADGNIYESEGAAPWNPNHVVRILQPVR